MSDQQLGVTIFNDILIKKSTLNSVKVIDQS